MQALAKGRLQDAEEHVHKTLDEFGDLALPASVSYLEFLDLLGDVCLRVFHISNNMLVNQAGEI